MGRRSERLSRQGLLACDPAGEDDVIQVVSRAFDVLRCFEGHEARLGNLEISNRCGLPRSTVSRLTHTLTRMGQLVYLPRDQKYRIGPSAVAMSTTMMKGLQLRNLIRLRLQDVAEQLPGTVGFVIPDRFHLVYLEYARAANALGLHESTGSRIAMATTAAGHAYTAALDIEVGNALVAEMEREIPEAARLLTPRLEGNRQFLRAHGYVVGSDAQAEGDLLAHRESHRAAADRRADRRVGIALGSRRQEARRGRAQAPARDPRRRAARVG